MEVFFGGPEGVGFTVSLFEHDHGDPNRFKEQVANAVDLAAEKTAALVAEKVPVVGLFLAAAPGPPAARRCQLSRSRRAMTS